MKIQKRTAPTNGLTVVPGNKMFNRLGTFIGVEYEYNGQYVIDLLDQELTQSVVDWLLNFYPPTTLVFEFLDYAHYEVFEGTTAKELVTRIAKYPNDGIALR